VSAEFLRKRKCLAGVSGAAGPFDDGLVLPELRDFPEPLCSARVRNGDNVGNVARSQTAADRELHSFQQAPGAPLFLEPVHGDGRPAVGRVPAAASLANGHMWYLFALRPANAEPLFAAVETYATDTPVKLSTIRQKAMTESMAIFTSNDSIFFPRYSGVRPYS
jgi:hypothetical protein